MPDAPLTANTFGEAPGTSKAARIRASVSRRIAAPIALIILTLAVLLVYLPGIDIPYHGDDFGWVDTSTGALRHFVQVNADGWYRPVQASVFTLVQKHFGLNTIPIHLLTFLPHALLCWLILITVIRLGYPPTYALMAAVFMA